MIYNSPETIPAKLYFKILNTEDLKLLSTESVSDEKLNEAWQKIEDEYSEININKTDKQKKTVNIYKKIESLSSELSSIELCIYHLRSLKDDDLIEKLKSYGYKFNWVKPEEDTEITDAIYHNDLDQIERFSEGLELKIKAEQRKLPKPKTKEESKEIPFDQTVLMYAAFTGLGYVNPNIIPLTQYDAMIANGNEKMKSLEKMNAKK